MESCRILSDPYIPGVIGIIEIIGIMGNIGIIGIVGIVRIVGIIGNIVNIGIIGIVGIFEIFGNFGFIEIIGFIGFVGIIDSLESESSSIDRILDWFHIAMKFKNTGLGDASLNKKLESAKWHLWHGDVDKCLEKLSTVSEEVKEDIIKQNKVKKLKTYIENNRNYTVHYSNRKNSALIFTSHLAEATVESLINQRCKNKV